MAYRSTNLPRPDLTGRVFGDWTVIRLNARRTKDGGPTHWRCRCRCGRVLTVPVWRLRPAVIRRRPPRCAAPAGKTLCAARSSHFGVPGRTRAPSRLTAPDIRRLVARRLKLKDLAAKYGVSISLVHRWAVEAGAARTGRGDERGRARIPSCLTPQDIDDLVARRVSFRQLAARYGVSDSTARRWTREAGVVAGRRAQNLLLTLDEVAVAVRMWMDRQPMAAIVARLRIPYRRGLALFDGFTAKRPLPPRHFAWCEKTYAAVASGTPLAVVATRARRSKERAAELLARYMGYVARDRIEIRVTVVERSVPEQRGN